MTTREDGHDDCAQMFERLAEGEQEIDRRANTCSQKRMGETGLLAPIAIRGPPPKPPLWDAPVVPRA